MSDADAVSVADQVAEALGRGDLAAAESLARRGVRLREREEPATSVGLAGAWADLAAVHRAQGRLAVALEDYRRALGALEGVVGDEASSVVAVIQHAHAALLADLGRDAEAAARG
ncbi:MAG TPA: hypothetical protein VM262_02905 [Acidimicrobiales bacterium]|nr:hypothetical protein [Acidimicrobiales bacterium]